MIPPSIRAVLFDFDGVIVHSEPLHCRAFQIVAKQQGIELTEAEYYQDLIGYDDRGAWRAIYELKSLPLDAATFQIVCRAKADTVRKLMDRGEFHALPGAEAFIQALAEKQIPLAICTGALRDEVETMLNAIQLRKYFSVITSAEDVEVGKPDPQGYLLTVDRLNKTVRRKLQTSDCLVIEDSPTVAMRAREVGFSTLGVATTFAKGAWPADVDVADSLEPSDVASLFDGLPSDPQ